MREVWLLKVHSFADKIQLMHNVWRGSGFLKVHSFADKIQLLHSLWRGFEFLKVQSFLDRIRMNTVSAQRLKRVWVLESPFVCRQNTASSQPHTVFSWCYWKKITQVQDNPQQNSTTEFWKDHNGPWDTAEENRTGKNRLLKIIMLLYTITLENHCYMLIRMQQLHVHTHSWQYKSESNNNCNSSKKENYL